VFSISAFQYTILAYAFSKSVPYRKWVLSNYQLMASFIMLTAFTIYLVMAPARVFQQQFELLIPPVLEFRYMLLGFAALNICVCVILEDFVVEILLQKLIHRLKLGNSNVPYKKVLDEIKSQPSWPPLSSTKLADGKRTASDINIDTRKAVLQLENVEILDENYIKKYFGSGGSVTNSIVAPAFIDTSIEISKEKDVQLSDSNNHELAAQVLNKTYTSSASIKIIDDSTNGVTSLNYHQHELPYNLLKSQALNVENRDDEIDESYAAGIVQHIEENNR